MRKVLGAMAACLLGVATPASAALVQLSISGTVQGTQSTIMCGPGSPASCLTAYPTFTRTESYGSAFTTSPFALNLVQGDNSFTYGDLRGTGLFSGTINYNNGLLTGRDLFFSLQSGGAQFGTIGGSTVFASASTFSVAPLAAVTAVPEPGAWALMLIGFLVVGSALRQRPKRALLPA